MTRVGSGRLPPTDFRAKEWKERPPKELRYLLEKVGNGSLYKALVLFGLEPAPEGPAQD